MVNAASSSLPCCLPLAFMRQVVDAVMLMHERNVVHYDLKADNCFVELHAGVPVHDLGLLRVEQFSVVVGDFGDAVVFDGRYVNEGAKKYGSTSDRMLLHAFGLCCQLASCLQYAAATKPACCVVLMHQWTHSVSSSSSRSADVPILMLHRAIVVSPLLLRFPSSARVHLCAVIEARTCLQAQRCCR